MKKPLQTLVAAAIGLAFAVGGYLFYQKQMGSSPKVLGPQEAGQMLLKAAWTGLDDQSHALTQWQGKVLVVNFWATWCDPCREEIPAFIKLQDQYGARGVQFIGIAVDQKERVIPYAKDMGINYPIMVGGIETMEIARLAGNDKMVLPFTVVVDRNGKAVSHSIGILKPEKLDLLLKPLL